jgi:hypothetical protein
MSLTTGMVSPQFLVRADEHFETVAPALGSHNQMPYKSQWQDVHGFPRVEDKDFNAKALLCAKLSNKVAPQQRAPSARMQRAPTALDHVINRQLPRPQP